MKAYTVTYEFDGKWWLASIRTLKGCHTQGRSIDQARNRIRDALSLHVGETQAEVAKLVDDVRGGVEVERARDAFRKADELEQKAREARAKAARDLVATFSRRDAGVLLNLSHQRIQQLVTTTTKKKGARTRKVA
jgi:predicted RNase H-like HicB family nuclease